MLFKNFRQKWRIAHNRCPYCRAKFMLADIFDGEFWCPSKLCPELHFIVKFNLGVPSMDRMHLNYQLLDNGGGMIPLPDEFIRFRSEIQADVEET